MKVLVTGGAGYIGSHTTRKLIDAGHRVLVVDNLSKGHHPAIDPRADFVQANIADEKEMIFLMRKYEIEAILHFAAFIEVGESVEDPYMYYKNNFSAALQLLSAAREAEIKRFVFSSTAACYGMPEKTPIEETAPLLPINPYGRSKMMVELALQDASRAYGLGFCALRYFNVAGAHPEALIGEAHEPESHLIPRILKAALTTGASASIFGTDYPTPDGTCIRDYIHVEDLAAAHVLALEAVQPGDARVYNLGSETGFSVREVLRACEKVTGQSIKIEEKDRRPGDPPVLIASSRKIQSELGWRRQYPDLETIIEHAWNWHRTHPEGYKNITRKPLNQPSEESALTH